jgi:hypothetical protein
MFKPFFCILYFLFFINICFAQTPYIEWQICLGGSGYDEARSIEQTSDGGYIVAGFSNSIDGDVTGNHGSKDYWVTKLDQVGNIEWQKSLGGSENDWGQSIKQTIDGGYVIAGVSGSNDGDVSGNHSVVGDFWIVKLNTIGILEWQKCYGGYQGDVANAIQQTADGGFIVTGTVYSNDGDVLGFQGTGDAWLIKLNPLGSIEWQKCLGGSLNEWGYSVCQTNDGGYILAGVTRSNDGDVSGNHGNEDFWVVKLNSTGNIEWQKCLGGSEFEDAYSIEQTNDGGYIVTGVTGSNNGDVQGLNGTNDFWVVKLNSVGNVEWQKCVGGYFNDWAHSIKQTIDGGYIVSGVTNSNNGDVIGNNGSDDSWIVKLNSTGNIEWQKCLGGSFDEEAFDIEQTSDGGYIIANGSYSQDGDVVGNHGSMDFWIVKLSPEMSIEENNNSTREKEVIRIIDPLGRETQIKKNVILLYQYDDGSVKRELIIE